MTRARAGKTTKATKTKRTRSSREAKTWTAVYADLRARNVTAMLSQDTVDFYAWAAKPFAAFLDAHGVGIREVTAADVRAWLAERQERGKLVLGHKLKSGKRTPDKRKDLTKRTVHALSRGATALLNFAVAEGLLDAAPFFKKVRIPSDEPHHVTNPDDWSAILTSLTKSALPERDIALFQTMLGSGLRRSEVANLKWSDLTFDDRRKVVGVFVKAGKGDKDRRSALGREGYEALRTWRTHLKATLLRWFPERDIPWVFPSIDHTQSLKWAKWYRGGCKGAEPEVQVIGPLQASSVTMMFRRLSEAATKEAGHIVHVTPHSLRHSCARRWQLEGVAINVIQQMLGHSSLATTQRYVVLSREEAQAQLLDRLAAAAAADADG